MPKVKAKPSPRKGDTKPAVNNFRTMVIVNACVIILILIAGAVGIWRLRIYVEKNLAFPSDRARVVLKNRPPWMSDFLSSQIVDSIRPTAPHSAMDQRMLADVAAMLRNDPWISSVRQVRRVYDHAPGDTIEVDCDYRAPVALVHWGEYFWLVDGDGIKLPEQYAAADLPKVMYGANGSMNIRIVEGIAHAPPETGRRWAGDDLTAALALVRKLYGLNYTEEIYKVNAANFGGRQRPHDAQLVLITRYQTEIRWGAPVTERIAEVPADRKLEALKTIVEKYHRVDGGHRVLDIRFDSVTFPTDELPGAGEPVTP